MLPIAERELRVAARNPKTYRSRSITACAVLATVGLTLWMMERLGSTFINGTDIFRGITTAALFISVFTGAAQTADCLSEEKRNGTLGLLFLTDLKGYDIVLGKLLATSLHTLYGLLAASPLFAITFMLGGVKLGEFWRIMLNLTASLLLSLSSGLLVSALSRHYRRAQSATSSIMLVFMFGLPGISELLRRNGYPPELASVLQFLSPLNTHLMAFDAASALRSNFFWWSVLTTLLLAFGFLGLASWILPRSWQDQTDGPNKPYGQRWRERWQLMKLGPESDRKKFRVWQLNTNPFYWLASRERFNTLPLWILIVTVPGALVGVWFAYANSDPNFAAAMCVVGGIVLALALVLNFSSTACQRLAEDRESGTLELLLSTPISVRTILQGQWRALGRQFVGPIAAIALVEWGIFWTLKSGAIRGANDDLSAGSVLLFATIALADLIALGWIGMWMALRVKLANHAAGAAFWRILLLPWPVVLLILILISWAWDPSDMASRFSSLASVTIVSVIMLNNLSWSIWSWRKLNKEFRTAATDRFQPPRARRYWW